MISVLTLIIYLTHFFADSHINRNSSVVCVEFISKISASSFNVDEAARRWHTDAMHNRIELPKNMRGLLRIFNGEC